MYLSRSAFIANLRPPNKQFKVKPELKSWDRVFNL